MKTTYHLSPNVRIVRGQATENAMVYHTLYGNPRIVNTEGLEFLNVFKQPRTLQEIAEFCADDPHEAIQDFSALYFLVEPGFDEKKFLLEQREKHLKHVGDGKIVDRMGLAISDSCNFGCTHCIHFQRDSNGNEILPTYQKPFRQLNMNWETAKKCIDHYIALMRKQGSDQCRIHFGNAEPLTNWELVEKILGYCAGMKELSFDFAINTNLSLLTRDIAETLKKYRVKIATSLDGMSRANNAIRITKGGNETFDSICQKFDLLSEINYPLDGFSITVAKGNFDLIDTDIIEWAAKRNMTSIAFDYDLVGLVETPVAERVAKLMHFKKIANKHGIDFFGTWDSAFRNLTSQSLLTGNHAFCAAVEGKSLEFNVDGSIKMCSHTTTPIGHINSFAGMFKRGSGMLNIIKQRFPGTDTYCSGCMIEGSCGGQCHVTREVAQRSLENKKVFEDMCDFYRSVTEALIHDQLASTSALTS